MDKLGLFLRGDDTSVTSGPVDDARSADEIVELEKLLIREPTLQRVSAYSIGSIGSGEAQSSRRKAKLKKYAKRESDESSIKSSSFKTLVDFSKLDLADKTSGYTDLNKYTQPNTIGVLDVDSAMFSLRGTSNPKIDKQRRKIVESQKKGEQALKEAKTVRPLKIQLKPYQIDNLNDAFNLLENGREVIDMSDAISILRACGVEPDPEQTRDIIKEIKPGDGESLNSEELVKLFTAKLQKKDSTDEIRRAFTLFDLDNKGLITLDNLQTVARLVGENLHEEELKEMIEAVDVKDKRGVSLERFVKFMSRKDWFD